MGEKVKLELTLMENKQGGWKEKIEPTKDHEQFRQELQDIVEEHGADAWSSYRAIIKFNGGKGDNPDGGSTVDCYFTNTLDYIWDILEGYKRHGRMVD